MIGTGVPGGAAPSPESEVLTSQLVSVKPSASACCCSKLFPLPSVAVPGLTLLARMSTWGAAACECLMELDSGMTMAAAIIRNAAKDRTSFDLRNPFMNFSPMNNEKSTVQTQQIVGERVTARE